MIPIFALREGARHRDVEQARDVGVTDILTTPISPKTIMSKLQATLTALRSFIVATEFFSADRRTWVAKKAKMDFTVI